MIDPRNSDIIIKEINELNQLIEHTQQMLSQFPQDKMLQLALLQDEQRKKKLSKELHLSISIYLYQFA